VETPALSEVAGQEPGKRRLARARLPAQGDHERPRALAFRRRLHDGGHFRQESFAPLDDERDGLFDGGEGEVGGRKTKRPSLPPMPVRTEHGC
jgi:hypothetical protein